MLRWEFFSAFGDGSNLMSMVVASVIIWHLTLLVLRGVSEAVAINAVVVVAQIVPIIVMLVAIVFAGAFKWEIFIENFAGATDSGSILEQVKSTEYDAFPAIFKKKNKRNAPTWSVILSAIFVQIFIVNACSITKKCCNFNVNQHFLAMIVQGFY